MSKNIQLPEQTVLDIDYLLRVLDSANLSDRDKILLQKTMHTLSDKKARMRNRKAYADIISAGANKQARQVALHTYLSTKQLCENFGSQQ